jgi:hypothetical protein
MVEQQSPSSTIVAKMQQLRQMQQLAMPQGAEGASQSEPSTAGAGGLLEPPELPGRAMSHEDAVAEEADVDAEQDRALLEKIQAVEKKKASVAARLETARGDLASSSRVESIAFVDALAARAAENAAAAVRAAAAEAENSAESEAMRQIAVLELQL